MLKKIKSIFIVDDEESAPKPRPDSPPSPPVGPQPTTTRAQGQVNEKFMEVLTQAVNNSNQPGFDYLEFRQALQNLANMPMDEKTRLQSAYALAQTMGVTAQGLIESARYYLSVLQAEQQKFNDAHAQQRARMIGSREAEAQRLHAENEHKQAEIERLSREIAANQNRIEEIKEEISESTRKIENTKSDFEATFTVVSGQIEHDIEKITKHIGAQ